MKLLGWTNWNDEDFEDIGDEGFYEPLIIEYMKEHGLRFSGDYHQHGEFGVPYFDNGKKYATSLRSWGALMAEVLNIPPVYETRGYIESNGKKVTPNKYETSINYNYCSWAWYDADEPVYPAENLKAD